MARPVFVMEEVLAMLTAIGLSSVQIQKFKEQGDFVLAHKSTRTLDEITVGSGLGKSGGHVELVFNDQLTQMDPKKAREIGLMLLEAAEAAISDQIMMTFLTQAGLSEEARVRALLDLREIRQGTREVSHPH